MQITIFVVSSQEEILGMFARKGDAEQFRVDAMEVLGGAFLGVTEHVLDSGRAHNPWTGASLVTHAGGAK